MVRWVLSIALALTGAAQAQSLRDCPSCPELIRVPAGSYMMGPAAGEEDREGVLEKNRDGPTHRVDIGYDFAIGKYEVTRGEFAPFVAATGRPDGASCWSYDANGDWADVPGRSWRNPGFAQTDRDPVVCVNWADATAYASWLGIVTGKTYRLPSEAEWEHAARAGSQTARPWGDSRDGACRYGNVADLTAAAERGWEKKSQRILLCPDGYVYTAPVGRFEPNALGLHDMLGNVWEWVEDCYNARYDGAPTDGSAWLKGDCVGRVMRGGSWFSDPSRARSAFRYAVIAGSQESSLGFRVARTF